ncbi:MAG: hypothetical protein IJ375_06995 [Oscillospiraceae bacterium]|nr:hypothetical protein [Oscillospiraceae bacterium]
MKKRILSLILCIAMCMGMVSMFSGCGSANTDAFVIMTEQLDGLFNPFYYTAAADGTIVSMTQISMLGADYVNGEVEVAYGENEAVVTKDYEIVENSDGTVTYNFVLKNGILFSDGQPLTMEDVLFNLYVYLDPVYTGSNTMYSTDIVGLSEYRTQTVGSGSDDSDDLISSQATSRAQARINELVNLFNSELKASATSEVGYEAMKSAIASHSLSSGYKNAISNESSEVTNDNLLADYEYALKLFKEELESDYLSAQESYTDEPYKSHSEFEDEVFCFMYTEGYVEVKYAEGADGKIDRTTIESLTAQYPSSVDSKEAAIDYVYNDTIARQLNIVLQYWATANTLLTEYTAKAKEVILHENVSDDGSLAVENISGIVSLGHTDAAGSTITVNGTDYTIASAHNEDGTVANEGEYDVLQITIDGVDPKAIWNFAFTVAPQHYYGEGSSVGVDIENSKFGVEFASFEFMTDVIQSTRNIKIPMGAGAYKATDSSNGEATESSFYTNNVVYFKANENFNTVGEGLENAKIEKIRYQIVSSNNAIAALESGTVHYISPALTTDNYEKLEKLSSKGMVTLTTDQLGYGYIGVNAAKVTDINLRKAIMCAMNTSLALDYYRAGTASQIYWPMSKISWAYPDGEDATDNGKDYPQLGTWNEDTARTNIEKYMQEAGVSAGDSALKVTFTIAGSSLQDHPTYKVFRDAANLLNELGWDVEVVCDTQALTKINTGSLEVWAAAWSSALDPDMYQVYHKDSSATSTLAWGYNYIKTSGSAEEMNILDDLSDLIDQARETNDKAVRSDLYQECMEQILDLAIELPVYQRSVLYAFNSKVIDAGSMPAESEMNPYSSPLDRIWEIEFAK